MNNFNLYFESVCADLIVESVQDIKDKLISMGWKYSQYNSATVNFTTWWFPLKDTSGYYLYFSTEVFSQSKTEKDSVKTESVETFSQKALDFIFTEDTTDKSTAIIIYLVKR
jgi:hypothetical protein